MQHEPATDIYTDEEHAQLNNVDYSNCGNKPGPAATDILTDEEQAKLDNVLDKLPDPEEKPKELSEEDLAEIMRGMIDRMNDPENPDTKRMKEYHYRHSMFNIMLFAGSGLLSALTSGYIYKLIRQDRNVKLDVILYVSAFLLLRTICIGGFYYYLTVNNNPSDSMIKFSNMMFNIIKILSILAMIFVVGLVAFLDLRLVMYCIPYVFSELGILYCYFYGCGGCSCH